MHPFQYSVGDILTAHAEGLLSKAEARAALSDLIPALREIANARALVAGLEED